MAFIEDNLLKAGGGITHYEEAITEYEELIPTLENLIALTWLRLIHNDLPKLVKQRYGTLLRSRSLASIKPEISQALDSLLEEIHTSEDVHVLQTAQYRQNRSFQPHSSRKLISSADRVSVSASSSHFPNRLAAWITNIF